MEKLELRKKLNFDKKEIHTPSLVFNEFCNQIKDDTNGYIQGISTGYDGFIESYSVRGALANLGASLALSMEKDIQDELGVQGNKTYKYEFYISSPLVDGYRFRICFYEYGIAGYPVKIVLEQGIADEISKIEDGGYIIEVNDEEKLKELLTLVLNSRRVLHIMQELVDASNVLSLEVESNDNR